MFASGSLGIAAGQTIRSKLSKSLTVWQRHYCWLFPREQFLDPPPEHCAKIFTVVTLCWVRLGQQPKGLRIGYSGQLSQAGGLGYSGQLSRAGALGHSGQLSRAGGLGYKGQLSQAEGLGYSELSTAIYAHFFSLKYGKNYKIVLHTFGGGVQKLLSRKMPYCSVTGSSLLASWPISHKKGVFYWYPLKI